MRGGEQEERERKTKKKKESQQIGRKRRELSYFEGNVVWLEVRGNLWSRSHLDLDWLISDQASFPSSRAPRSARVDPSCVLPLPPMVIGEFFLGFDLAILYISLLAGLNICCSRSRL
jgi:hypothetical protein